MDPDAAYRTCSVFRSPLLLVFQGHQEIPLILAKELSSSVGLGFLNPMSQLRQANVMAFCMQLENSEER